VPASGLTQFEGTVTDLIDFSDIPIANIQSPHLSLGRQM
jgi:hypothetical protein